MPVSNIPAVPLKDSLPQVGPRPPTSTIDGQTFLSLPGFMAMNRVSLALTNDRVYYFPVFSGPKDIVLDYVRCYVQTVGTVQTECEFAVVTLDQDDWTPLANLFYDDTSLDLTSGTLAGNWEITGMGLTIPAETLFAVGIRYSGTTSPTLRVREGNTYQGFSTWGNNAAEALAYLFVDTATDDEMNTDPPVDWTDEIRGQRNFQAFGGEWTYA